MNVRSRKCSRVRERQAGEVPTVYGGIERLAEKVGVSLG